MSFSVKSPYQNPFEAMSHQFRGWFVTGFLGGVCTVLAVLYIASWDEWKPAAANPPAPAASTAPVGVVQPISPPVP
jgi:hypothetical protein